jgi:hypothetical protein
VQLLELEANPLKEDSGNGVGVLVGIQNVGAVAVEKLGERGHDATPIGTGDE